MPTTSVAGLLAARLADVGSPPRRPVRHSARESDRRRARAEPSRGDRPNRGSRSRSPPGLGVGLRAEDVGEDPQPAQAEATSARRSGATRGVGRPNTRRAGRRRWRRPSASTRSVGRAGRTAQASSTPTGMRFPPGGDPQAGRAERPAHRDAEARRPRDRLPLLLLLRGLHVRPPTRVRPSALALLARARQHARHHPDRVRGGTDPGRVPRRCRALQARAGRSVRAPLPGPGPRFGCAWADVARGRARPHSATHAAQALAATASALLRPTGASPPVGRRARGALSSRERRHSDDGRRSTRRALHGPGVQ